ncbi:MAG TPA: Holliday junction resolvase RuvX [Planctomycetes bacterium]|nr:Holliday junction resolvase RuvX [Planctomycetota bacterium]HIJ69729.1 Holliday junction resolvase RuvX [Planctomycetota bacterium]
MRYLGIDYGQKRTGLAVSDAGETIASPLKVLTMKRDCLVAGIVEIVKLENVDAIVLGLPLNMDGTAGSGAKLVRSFAKRIKDSIDVPIHFQDERLSSFDAQGKLAGADLTRKKKKKRLDAVAAASILQSFLDEKRRK